VRIGGARRRSRVLGRALRLLRLGLPIALAAALAVATAVLAARAVAWAVVRSAANARSVVAPWASVAAVSW
jgi:hypothetical protein